MTRAQIRKKYGIEQLEHPSIANKKLSEKEADAYEEFCKTSAELLTIAAMRMDQENGSDDPDDIDPEPDEKLINELLKNRSDEDMVPYPDPQYKLGGI